MQRLNISAIERESAKYGQEKQEKTVSSQLASQQ